MAHLPEGQAHFEYTKMQLVGSLNAVAETMRNCASFAEQFAQLIAPITYPGAPLMFPNGQIPQMPPPQMEPTGRKRKGQGGDDDGEGKRKRKTKPKDPNAPKRPPSSYLLFQNEVRQELKSKNPNISNNELLAKISKAWSEMPKEQKDRYEQRQAVAKTHYEEQKKQYAAKNLPPDAAPVAAAQAIDPAIIAAVPVPVASPAAASSDDDHEEDHEEKEEDGQDESSSSDDSDDDDEPQPPSKKPKQVQVKSEVKKEKKKTKA